MPARNVLAVLELHGVRYLCRWPIFAWHRVPMSDLHSGIVLTVLERHGLCVLRPWHVLAWCRLSVHLLFAGHVHTGVERDSVRIVWAGDILACRQRGMCCLWFWTILALIQRHHLFWLWCWILFTQCNDGMPAMLCRKLQSVRKQLSLSGLRGRQVFSGQCNIVPKLRKRQLQHCEFERMYCLRQRYLHPQHEHPLPELLGWVLQL
jgi:hypothetical protein